MPFTVTDEPVPLDDCPFIDLAFASCAPKLWETDALCCVGRIPSAGQIRSSPTGLESISERPRKIRRTGISTCSSPEAPTPGPGVFLNTKQHRFSSIAEALRSAVEGDTLLLRPGVHKSVEPLVVDKRNITITHSDDAENACPSSPLPLQDCNPSHCVALIATSSSCAVHLRASGCLLRGVAIKNTFSVHGAQEDEEQNAPAVHSPSHMCIAVDGDDSRVDHCNIEGGHGAGIVIRSQRSAVRSCSIHRCSQAAVSCHSASRIEIASSSFMKNRGLGIAVHDECDGTIEGNVFCQTGGTGIECLDRSRPTIRDNHILDGLSAGIWIRGNATPALTSNRLFRNIVAGIRVSDESDPRVEHNRVCDGRQSGVVIEGRARGSFFNNSMYGHQQCGVCVGGSAQPFFMANAMTANQAGGALLGASSHTVWVQNQVQRNQVLGVGIRGAATLCMTRDLIEGNGGAGLCVRGAATLSAEHCVVSDNVGAGIRCWDGGVGNLGRCRVDGAGGRGKQTIGLFCGGTSRVQARQCALTGHALANVAANQAAGGGGELSGCRIMGAEGEGVLLCGHGTWELQQNRLQDNTTCGVRCSGETRVVSDGDVVERTKGTGFRVDGRSMVELRNARVVRNLEDGVSLAGGADLRMEQCLVMGNGCVGVRAHGEAGSSLRMRAAAVANNAKGALRAGKAGAVRVFGSVLAGGARASAAPVVLEGRRGTAQSASACFEDSVTDGLLHLGDAGGGWRSAQPGAHGTNRVLSPALARRLARQLVEDGVVCRRSSAPAATALMPDGTILLACSVSASPAAPPPTPSLRAWLAPALAPLPLAPSLASGSDPEPEPEPEPAASPPLSAHGLAHPAPNAKH